MNYSKALYTILYHALFVALLFLAKEHYFAKVIVTTLVTISLSVYTLVVVILVIALIASQSERSKEALRKWIRETQASIAKCYVSVQIGRLLSVAYIAYMFTNHWTYLGIASIFSLVLGIAYTSFVCRINLPNE